MTNHPAARLVSGCWTNGTSCETCGARNASVVLRTTTHGPACLVLCPGCQTAAEPLELWTAFAAHDHQTHVTRALDAGEIR